MSLRQRGRSYNFISKNLGVPKSTLSDWFSNISWSQRIKNELARKANYVARKRLRLINKERRAMWERWREKARQSARKDFNTLRRNSLFVAGIMLYWGEGDSNIQNGSVRLVNTDPEMIRIFSLFLQKICKVPKEKIKIQLTLYPDLMDDRCRIFWSRAINVPIDQFIKTQYIKGRHPTKRLKYGICLMYVSSRELKEKIFVWLKLYQQTVR